MNQRTQLSKFLKDCRARITPADLGLPDGGRRRTPGLRREDVAALAGVSITWYTWLEQGRDVRASEAVLEKISRTLQLSAEERDYLFVLAQNRPPPLVPGCIEEVSPPVQRMLDALSVPALVMTIRWDVVAWNWLVAKAFRDYGALPPEQRNLLRILLTDPAYQADPEEYDGLARRVLAKFRSDYSQGAGDPAFDRLIDELTETCPQFRRLWGSTEIMGRAEGINVIRHPRFGGMRFEHTSYVVEGAPTLRAVIFTPDDAESAAKIARIAREDAPAAPERRDRHPADRS